MEGMSVREMLLGIQESYQEAQSRVQEENRAFTRTGFFHMGKFGTYHFRILSIAPNSDGSSTRPGYEYPIHQLLPELGKPATENEPQKVCVTITRAAGAGYGVDPIETYRCMTVEAAEEDRDDKLAEKIAEGSFRGGLKYDYGHRLYVFDLDGRTKDARTMTPSHTQFEDLDERKFRLWNKKLTKNPSYPRPISSVHDTYPVEIEERESGAETEYVVSIDNESEPVLLIKEKPAALAGAPYTPKIIYRYIRYHPGATVEFLRRCDGIYGISLMETDEVKTIINTPDGKLPRENISIFLFGRRTRDNRESGREDEGVSPDDLFERHDELQQQKLGRKTEEDQELRVMVCDYIEQERPSARVIRSMDNRELLDLIENEMKGPKPSDEPEGAPEEEKEQPEETEEHAGRPRHRR